MSDSELHICKARKGANFTESFYSTNEDCESDDLTGIPGKAYLFQPRHETNSFGTVVSHCEKVAEYDLSTYFTDVNSPNFDFIILQAELELLEEGIYEVLFVIGGEEMPDEGAVKLSVLSAL